MAIEWSNVLATGVEWQDSQHRELFHRINSLLDAMSMGLGKEEVVRLFKFLDEYFVFHFSSEEEAMRKYGYPGAHAHISEHKGFMADVEELKKEASASVTTSVVIKVQRRVVDWLINHIGGMDKSLGAFVLKANGSERHGSGAPLTDRCE